VTRGRRGLALPLALLALVVIGAVVAAAFTLALLEQRTGQNTLFAVQAAGAAEAGAAAVVGEWAAHGLGALLPGDSAVLPVVQLPAGTVYQATAHRRNAELFELRIAGIRIDADGGTLARHELGLILRRVDSAGPGEPPVRLLANRAWNWLTP
jgi:hypothetical protein